MSDLRTQLDRVADRAPSAGDPFERLVRRRRIRQRNRRITAAALALVVSAGGSVLAVRAFGHARSNPPGTHRLAGAVQDPELRFDVKPGAHLRVGRSVLLHVSLPAGTDVVAGSFSREACGGGFVSAPTIEAGGVARITAGVGNPALNCISAFHDLPVRGTLVAYVPPTNVPPGTWTYTVPLIRDWYRSGQIPHLTLVPVWFVSGKASTHAGPYPRGAFGACPDLRGTLSPTAPVGNAGISFGRSATGVALRFSKLWAAGDRTKARRYEDPSARNLTDWAAAGNPSRFRVLHTRSARNDGLVRYGCGPRVAKRSWEVVIDDGTKSASLDFTIHLVDRASGWKVWGSY